MKLFLKVSRIGLPHTRRVFAWTSLRSRGLGAMGVMMSEAEASEFEFAMERNAASVTGAGGQYDYKVYDRIGEPQGSYAVVKPTVQAVIDQYPNACRVVNMRTGQESGLCLNPAEATEIAALAAAGKLKGSFN